MLHRCIERLAASIILFLITHAHAADLTMTAQTQLTFSTHDLTVRCFGGARDLYLEYAGTPHRLCSKEPGRDKTPDDDRRYPRAISGTYTAFVAPVKLRWRDREGIEHEHEIDLDTIFKDRKVLHQADPARIYQSNPLNRRRPIIVIEVDDKTVNVGMFVTIQILPTDPTAKLCEPHDYYTRAYSKTF